MTIENTITLLTLIFLQGVLGVDNLLYIAIESRRVAPEFRKRVRRIGIIVAVALRIVLLVVLIICFCCFPIVRVLFLESKRR